MPKFSATKLGDLLTDAHTRARLIRSARYSETGKPYHSAVMIEADDGSWCEMDAEDAAHATRLATNAVAVLKARGASCREVLPSGRVKLKPFFMVFEDYGDNDCDEDGEGDQ